ncbi:MAG: hypothetical protein AAGC78_03240 [Cellvibrio sp.]|uniref:hypothetical protein n=1 Tax=Cellvibrio sp. TaxID=1965322 RepID=UPI0031AB8E9B
MGVLRFKKIKSYVAFVSVLLAVIVTLYSFVPKVLEKFNPLNEKEIETLLQANKSFITNGNVEGMLSLFHPEFTLEAIHSTGREEAFDKSQISKHEELLTKAFSLQLIEGFHITSILNSTSAIVSSTSSQVVSINEALVAKEKIFQTIYIVKYKGEPKILKVLSIAEKI